MNKLFEEAVKATGRPASIDISSFPEDMREYHEAQYQMIVITEYLNDGWKPDWTNEDEPKYFPYFLYKNDTNKGSGSSGGVFGSTYYSYSNAYAGYGSHLCYKARALAERSGQEAIEIWNKILLK
ncbi:hypothetical protein MASR1M31_03330 [Porphyromonadaceae bacterium]